MCVFKYHAFIFLERPPPWYGTLGILQHNWRIYYYQDIKKKHNEQIYYYMGSENVTGRLIIS